MTSDTGLFGPDSMTWRIASDPSYAVGTLTSLFLQGLHPRALAAVDQSGGFEDDFWGRFSRTGEYLGVTTFGDTRSATRAGARVRGIHRQVRAVDPATGTAIRADEPELLGWVHNALLISVIRVVQRSGFELTKTDADRFVFEQVKAAELVGLSAADVPHDVDGLHTYLNAIRPSLAITDTARDAARAFARPPMAGWVQMLTPARPAWQGLAALSMALLPAWARKMYGLPGWAVTDAAAIGALRALRRTALAVPEKWRQGPSVRALRAEPAA